MASKRSARRKQCEGKNKYLTIDEAVSAADHRRRAVGAALDAYRCPFCGAFHIGHRTKSAHKAIAAKRGYR
jgi:hypothetical protein